MHECPVCKQTFRVRSGGACPHCGEALEKYGNRYYSTRLGNPVLALLEYFEKQVSQRMSTPARPVYFQVPRNSAQYKRELVEAGKLLDLCVGDLGLAQETIRELFVNRQFFANYSSLIGLSRRFLLAKAVVDANRRVLAEMDAKQKLNFDQAMEGENLFG